MVVISRQSINLFSVPRLVNYVSWSWHWSLRICGEFVESMGRAVRLANVTDERPRVATRQAQFISCVQLLSRVRSLGRLFLVKVRFNLCNFGIQQYPAVCVCLHADEEIFELEHGNRRGRRCNSSADRILELLFDL